MALPAYQIVVINPNTGLVAAVFDGSAFYNLRYSKALNGIGTMALVLPSTPDIRTVFEWDTLIEIYRADLAGVLQRQETFICCTRQRYIEGDKEQFVIGGVSLNHLLSRRIIDPRDDPVSTDGYSTKSGQADQVLYDYVNEQAGPGAGLRALAGLSMSAVTGVGQTVYRRLRYQNLFTQAQGIAQAGQVDFWIERTVAANVEFSTGIMGTDRTYTTNSPLGQPWLALDPLRGNLTNPSLLYSRKDEGNMAYVLGQGLAENRQLLTMATLFPSYSRWHTREYYEDARNVNLGDLATLASQGSVSLEEHKTTKEFKFQPTGTEPGFLYWEDWQAGDAVTAVWEEDFLDVRITRVEVWVDSDETIRAELSDQFTFPV